MTDYAKGWADAIEAAARDTERYIGAQYVATQFPRIIAKSIRALAPPASPPTREARMPKIGERTWAQRVADVEARQPPREAEGARCRVHSNEITLGLICDLPEGHEGDHRQTIYWTGTGSARGTK